MIQFGNYEVEEIDTECCDDFCTIRVLYKGYWFSTEAETYDKAYKQLLHQLDTTKIIEYPYTRYNPWI